ncbi:hypothetical protein HMPREF0535_1399, partial [Limosilactobacillus reuteri MM2-3]
MSAELARAVSWRRNSNPFGSNSVGRWPWLRATALITRTESSTVRGSIEDRRSTP